jgi:cysteine synthase
MSGKDLVFGPTYEEMLHPEKIDPVLHRRTINEKDSLNPEALFNITWKDGNNTPHYMVIPPEITGVEANIIVLLGKHFPTGSHKVGSTYSVTMEKQLENEIHPLKNTLVYPSTGNFGIGGAWVAGRMGYESMVILPSSVSRERFDRIVSYGGRYIKASGLSGMFAEANRVSSQPGMTVMNQFISMANYRFHYYVTGNTIVELMEHLKCLGIGNGRCEAFISAVGSGGTIAAGDRIKQLFPENRIVALEPLQCPTLYSNGSGDHDIQGIGDGLVTWVHNVLNMDAVMCIDDQDCKKGLRLLTDPVGKTFLSKEQKIPSGIVGQMAMNFGISGICNLLGAIRTAKYFKLPRGTNIVTVCTDSIDRYHSVMKEMEEIHGPLTLEKATKTFETVFQNRKMDHIQEGTPSNRQRWFEMKRSHWVEECGMDEAELNAQKNQDWWEKEQAKCQQVDKQILELRRNIERTLLPRTS